MWHLLPFLAEVLLDPLGQVLSPLLVLEPPASPVLIVTDTSILFRATSVLLVAL